MSELWFRAYHKEYGMIYPDEHFSLEDAVSGDLMFFGSPSKDYDTEDFTFMLATGVRDIHGTHVYGDDIIRDGNRDIWAVRWNRHLGQFGLYTYDQERPKRSNKEWRYEDSLGSLVAVMQIEVVGTIHEHLSQYLDALFPSLSSPS